MPTDRRVYVVDDDDMVRRASAFALGVAGYEATVFRSGAEFIERASQLAPGCALIDVRMPAMDGFELMERLTGYRSRFPVIMMTGHGDVATAVRAMKHGAVDFLEKPYDEHLLFSMLDSIFATLDVQMRTDQQRLDASERLRSLSSREMDVLRGLIAGFPNKLVAEQLNLSVRTVEMHRANLMEKLDVRALADVLRLAFHAGIMDQPDTGNEMR